MIIAHGGVRAGLNRLAAWFGRGPVGFPPVPADGRILFFRRDRGRFSFLSNFALVVIDIPGQGRWASVEHYYQSRKSHHPDYHARIRRYDKPSMAKYIGDSRIDTPYLAKRSWFRKHPGDLRDDWNDATKLRVMRAGLEAKFRDPAMRAMLLATGDAELVEDSERDGFWGAGDGSGANHLGVMLMEIRSRLRRP